MKFKFNSIRSRLVFTFLMVSIIPLILMVSIIIEQRTRVIKQNAFSKLTAIRDLKSEQVNAWLDERIGDIHNIHDEDELLLIGNIVKKQTFSQTDIEKLDIVRQVFQNYVQNYTAYHEIFFIDAETGKIVVSSNESSEGDDKSSDEYFTEPVKTRDIHIKDIYYSKTINQTTMAFSIPVFSDTKEENVIGALVTRINLERSLYPLLLNRTGLNETGETLIVNKDVVALNELRWFENAPLNLKINAEPAVNAANGATGIAETTDYRGVKILAAYTYIPKTGWGFVAKEDLSEVYSPVSELRKQMLLLFALFSIGTVLVAIATSSGFAKPIIEITEVTKKLESGDLNARSQTKQANELGFLASAVNRMADSIQSQLKIQEHGAEITSSLVGEITLKDAGNELLKKIQEISDSQFAGLYLLNESDNIFEHVASIGATPELLEPFNAGYFEGEFGKVLTSGTMSHIKDIPEDTRFVIKTAAIKVIPREIITLPIDVDGKIKLILTMSSINEYPLEIMESLNQSMTVLNAEFASILGNEETQKLSNELQSNNEELQAVNEELQSQTEELQEQSGELKLQAEELEKRRLQVEESDRLKSEFLSNMSHELRTPLNSILALSQLMRSRGTGKKPEQDSEYLEIIERNGRNLLSLINDILDLSKVEAGRMELMPSEVEPGKLALESLENIRQIAEKKGIDLKTNIDEVPVIYSDRDKIRQILLNLLSNAIKFTSEGEISLSVACVGESIHYTVRDTGIGISEENQKKIFDEFRQVDGSTTRRFEGTGLGLSIARKMAMLLGGSISVQSNLGEGSTFTFELPLRSDSSGGKKIELPVRANIVKTSEKRTILVVDDEPEICARVSEILTSSGYDVVLANNGKECLRIAKEIKPFAITLDVIMPELDGWEVIRQLKDSEDTKDIPVIILSMSDDRDTGTALGAAGYIVKPIIYLYGVLL